MAREVVLRFVGDAGQLNRTFQQVDATAASTMARMQGAVAAASGNMAARFTAAGAAMAAVGAKTRRVGTRLSVGITAPLAFIAKSATGTAIDYERSMNVLQAVSGASAEQMAAFGRRAQELGADITLPGTSAADAGAAMVELAKAGLSVSDSMAAARGVLQLSAAGGLDNAAAATVAANALNAFRLEGSEASRVADLLAGAANASSAEVTDLADSLTQGASVFAAAGIPIEDFVSAAGLLANVGIKGSDAGTSLKQMLLKLQNPSKEAAQTLADLGVSVYDAAGGLRPLSSLISDFTARTSGLTQQQRDTALATIFGSDAVRAANAVLLAGVPAFSAMKAATTEQGAAAKLAAARNKGLGGAIDALRSAMETFSLKVILPALPILTRFVLSLADLLPRIAALPKPVLIGAAAFAGLLAAVGPLMFIFGAMASAIGVLLSPIGLVIAAVGALGVAIFAALNPEKAAALFAAFQAKWAEMAPKVVAHLEALGAAVWAWLQVNVPIIVARLAAWAQAFIEWVLPLIPPLLVRLGHLLGAIGNWIFTVGVPALAEGMKSWIPAFVGWVAQGIPPLINELRVMLERILVWIVTEALPAIAGAAAKLAGGVAQGLGNAAVDLLPGPLKGAVKSTGGLVGKAAKSGGGFVGGALNSGASLLGFARGGALLGVRRPTPVLVGEGRGREDMLAVPHSKGGLAALGGSVSQVININGGELPTAAALEYSNRHLGWMLAASGRR